MIEPAQHIVELLRIVGQVDDHVAVDAALDDAGVGEEDVHRHVTLERDARDDRLVGAAAVEDEAQTLARARREIFGRALRKDERFGDVGLRVCEHIADVADLGDAALVDDSHALADLLDDAHLVRDDDDRHAERLVDLLEQV